MKNDKPCTPEAHEALKLDDAAWYAATYSIANGVQLGCEWRNCSACHSTLLRPVARVAEAA